MVSVSPKQAIDSAPQSLSEAEERFKGGDLVRAEALCRDALRLQSSSPDGLNLLGRILVRQGHTGIGIAFLKQAVAGNQRSAKLQRHLGKALLDCGKTAEAVTCLLSARTLDPSSSATLHSLGTAFLALGQLDDAEAVYREAVEIEPRDARACFELINVLQSKGRQQEALSVFQRAVSLMPGFRRTHLLAAHQFRRNGQLDAARRTLENGLALQPRDEELAFSLDSLNGGTTFQRAPDQFVTAYFDDYAPTFDQHLLQSLDYHAPELVAEEIRRLYGDDNGNLTILDMGCGTGLCGVFLRPLARRLIGIDLSVGMLAQARARQIYDELAVTELTAYLSNTDDEYDLVVAADVLVYFGDLRPVLLGMTRILHHGGVFVATFERSDTTRYMLHSAGRYAHSEEYLRHVAALHQLESIKIHPCELRTEFGKPVRGYLAVFRKP